MKTFIFILTIDTKYGIDTLAFTSHDKAIASLYQFVAEWWEDEDMVGPIPDDANEAIALYFNNNEDEFYRIEESVLDPE